MKKLLLSLMTVSVAASGALSVVACGTKTYKEIYLITDAGSISDKSFNESGYNGSNYFVQNILGQEGYKIAYIEPKAATQADLSAAYSNAQQYGAKTLVLPGFHHAQEGGNEAPKTMGDSGSTIILDKTSSGIPNQLGVVFRGDMSGFYAGFASIVASLNLGNYSEANGVKTVSLAAYGGLDDAGSVTNFIVGFLAAAEVFNSMVESKNPLIDTLLNAEGVDATKVAAKSLIDTSNPGNYFIGGFGMDEAQTTKAKNLSTQFLDAGANVIMPVAGPHTGTTLGTLKEAGAKAEKTMVVGVDTDQVLSYRDYKNKFLTSATKDLVNATIVSLGHVKAYVEDTKVQDAVARYAADNKIVLTYDTKLAPKEKAGKTVDFSADKALNWEGYDLWSDGKIAVGGDNKVTEDQYEQISNVLTPDIVRASSVNLFTKISGSSTTILTDADITAYATTIINGLTK